MMNPQYATITQLNNYIKRIFDENIHLRKVYLRGEISNFKNHTSGHLYLTLKDNDSRINAIMFKSSAAKLSFVPTDGMSVLVEGRVSAYPATGAYQIYIDKMDQDGLGNLYIEYEKLKKKLLAEGLFDPAHKRPLPKYPMRIGIVTASTGAAVKDIISTIKRRFPICETLLFPTLVQGASSAPAILKNILKAQEYSIDILIIGRGGGSIEDLWAFNDENVARAIYNSRVPVISAVGHEIDFTIADFVADMRAPTPTGAAEMAVPMISDVKELLTHISKTLTSSMEKVLLKSVHLLTECKTNYILNNPMVLYDTKIQKLDMNIDSLKKNILQYLGMKTSLLEKYKQSYILNNPSNLILGKQNKVKNDQVFLTKNIKSIMMNKENQYLYLVQTLKLVNPLNILDKGYSLIKKDGHIIKDSSTIKVQDELNVVLAKGKMNVVVKEIL